MRNDKSVSKFNVKNKIDLSNLRLTLDTNEDYKLSKFIFEYFKTKKNINFTLNDILKLKKKNEKLFL